MADLAYIQSVQSNAPFINAVRDLLQEAEDRLTDAGAESRACGRCCDFKRMGHRLYLSTGEMAVLLTQLPPHDTIHLMCPYQIVYRCHARENRALGCRTFFCDKVSDAAGQQVYEEIHRQLRQLHEQHGIEYIYRELTAWIDELLR